MKSSLSKIQLFNYIKSLIDYNLPDHKKFSTRNLKTMIFDGLDRLEYLLAMLKINISMIIIRLALIT